MKTPEEIKRGLECYIVQNTGGCENIPCRDCSHYNPNSAYTITDCKDALAYIQQLECERDEARNDLDTINYANTELHSAYEAMKRERDAAVADMTELMQLAQFCRHCKHLTQDGECNFDFVANKGEPWCWQWRGVEAE